jgi:DNA-binding NarL/FixJ family response regulator
LIRIFIADDHAMFAEGLESLLATEPDFEVCGIAGTAAETLERLKSIQPDVLLLDINLSDGSGLDVARTVHAEWPNIKVLALTMFSDESYITAMLGQGAKGYLLKNTGKDELCMAIRRLSEGKSYFGKDVTETVMRSLMREQQPVTLPVAPKISRREKEVLQLIIDECTTQEIAARLFLSEKTVESHRAALLAKLGARNTAGLVKVALQWDLLKDPTP